MARGDAIVFYTATLAPVAAVVAAVRRAPLELLGVVVLSALAIAGQAMLPRLARDERLPILVHPFVRLGLALLYVAAMTAVVGGAPFPLLCLFVPVVAGAAAIGAREAVFTAVVTVALQLFATQSALAIANSFLHAEVTELAIRDPLTGLYNRRHFDAMLERLLVAHHRHRASSYRPISAIVFDLDNFGTFNNSHGHQVGDEVLRTFAGILRERFRVSDLVARTGGEEFVAILDGAARDQAVAVAEEVRSSIAGTAIDVPEGQISVTVSAGCAQLDESEPTRAALLRTADVALFMAKRGGRDRVVAA